MNASRRTPARISHQASAAAADTGMSTALRSVGLLDVVSTTSPGPSVARLVSTPVSTASRRTPVRNAGSCGLGIRSFGSIGKSSHAWMPAMAMRSKPKAARIYNYPLKREAPEK
jgi:hypothetical protein